MLPTYLNLPDWFVIDRQCITQEGTSILHWVTCSQPCLCWGCHLCVVYGVVDIGVSYEVCIEVYGTRGVWYEVCVLWRHMSRHSTIMLVSSRCMPVVHTTISHTCKGATNAPRERVAASASDAACCNKLVESCNSAMVHCVIQAERNSHHNQPHEQSQNPPPSPSARW